MSETHVVDLGALAPGLGAVCRDYFKVHTAQLETRIAAGRGGLDVAQRRAAILDGLLGALFCAAEAATSQAGMRPVGRVALVSVGSYGRATLALHSDVDVVFLCDDPDEPAIAAMIEGLLYPLWDAGLKLGHATRGIDDTLVLARSDVTTATTLLDMRRIAGDRTIVQELMRRGRKELFEEGLSSFLDALEKDTYERQERFGGSLYLLEPEIKLVRGGLRDYDVGLWATRARWNVPSLEALTNVGALSQQEVVDLRAGQDMLFRVRNLLHLRAKRNQDRLTFEDQEECAVHLGFKDRDTLGVEQFMQSYYLHARNVASIGERLLKRSRPFRRLRVEPLRDLPSGIVGIEDAIGFHKSWALDTRPELALELFVELARHGRPTTDDTRDLIARWATDPTWCQALRRARSSAALFCKLLCHAGEAPVRRNSLLGELNELGLLLAMIPEFKQVTGRVQHDVYHVYTVDVHTVAAVDRLRALMRGDLAHEQPFASQMAADAVRPLPLFLGVLLHDIGKAYGKDHSRQGAIMAKPICERLGLPPLDVAHVTWLVEQHLSLYHWATRRDTSDPATIEEVARLVGSVDRLRDLFLLTVCDVSTTNPKAMTEWKARLLEDLVVAVSRVLDGQAPDPAQRAEEIRKNVRIGFVGDAGQERLEAFVNEMPERYLLAHPVDVIRAHARAARDRGDRPVHVAVFPGPAREITELLVLTDDRPGLLADTAAALSASRAEITAAQVFFREREDGPDEAVDLLQIRPSQPTGEPLSPTEVSKICEDIESILEGQVSAEQLLRQRSSTPSWARRRAPVVPTRVVIDNNLSPRYTVVDVYAHDHVGLLYAIAEVMRSEGLSIALSKVNTEGMKAADVFYVVRDGNKLDATQCETLRHKLFDAVEDSRERP